MCKNCTRELDRQWQKENPEKVREKARRHREKDPEGSRERSRRWYSRKSYLPCSFTSEDKARALDYFNGCCAVCGRPLRDLFGEHTAALDHWIPVADPRPDNPGTVVTNMLPLCDGIGGCNNRKGWKDPVKWLTEEYGAHKAAQILKRIEQYFTWVVEQ